MSREKHIPVTYGVNSRTNFPVPLASHEDVVKDKILFMNTLASFHFSLGSKFMVPVIGGKKLNLYVLYVEVTMRGGYDKVVTEKKWSEVGSVFDYSPKITSASYALRKHYFTLLHHYELVYFFRHVHDSGMPSQNGQSSFQAVGTIDRKFDCGYLVSVKLGDETLNGILFHHLALTPQPQPQPQPPPQPCTAIVQHIPTQPSRKPRRRKEAGDPGRPKANRSGYNFFFSEKHAELKATYPTNEREFTKMIVEAWNNLSTEERMVYHNYGAKDKERYQREMIEYKERLKQDYVQENEQGVKPSICS